MNCKLVFSSRSQFFHSRRFFSNQAKLRSTTQRLGMTLKACSSLLHCHMLAQDAPDALCKGQAYIAAVAQQALHSMGAGLAVIKQ